MPDGRLRARGPRGPRSCPACSTPARKKGLFISWNDGGEWQPLDLNLPAVPITDLRVRDDALAVATQGRAFWVLDDLFVLRQAAVGGRGGSRCRCTHRRPWPWAGRAKQRAGSFEGENPSPDLPIYYYLARCRAG
jgi:hypothetical protein